MANWDQLWSDALSAASEKLKSHGGAARQYVETAAAEHRQSLKDLATLFAKGEITKVELEKELADEQRVLRAELLAVQAITKKAAQDAANAFIEVIEAGVTRGVAGLL
jgi:hypothetical protein